MASILTPPRLRGEEILDRADLPGDLVARSLGDVAKVNALFGGVSAVLAELRDVLPDLPSRACLLDVGSGLGDIARSAAAAARRRGIELTTIGLDLAAELAPISETDEFIRADALHLPVPSRSIDIVICSQFLHHLLPDEATALIREMTRVARVRVIVSDLRRSWLAAAGLWVASFPLGFHPVSRHDGVVSVMRGFTRRELEEIVSRAIGVRARVKNRRGFRVTASWTPAPE